MPRPLCHAHILLGLVFLYDVMSLVAIFSNEIYAVSCAVSAKNWRVSKIRCVSKKTCWVIKMPDDDSAKDSWVASKQKFAVSAKISWFGKIWCVSKIWLVSTNTVSCLGKNMLYYQNLTSLRNELIQQIYAVSAKTSWVIKMPDDDSTKTPE